MIEAGTLWVVNTGIPKTGAVRITAAEPASAATPLIGCSLTISWPSVLMMHQPPPAVPAALAGAGQQFVHRGGTFAVRGHALLGQTAEHVFFAEDRLQ
jgi:hypothetical protein